MSSIVRKKNKIQLLVVYEIESKTPRQKEMFQDDLLFITFVSKKTTCRVKDCTIKLDHYFA